MSESPNINELPAEELEIIGFTNNEVPSTLEGGLEVIPTKEEVLNVVDDIIPRLIESEEDRQTLEKSITLERYSEDGALCDFEVTLVLKSTGEKIELTYMRAGVHGNKRHSTGIDANYYDDSGYPCAGPHTNVAELIDGRLQVVN